MRLPWVSRLAYDVAVARAEAAEQREATLLSQYHDLMQRRASTDHLHPAKPPEAPTADLVMLAVGQQASGNPALGRYLSSYVQMERAKRAAGAMDALDETALLKAVTHWDTTRSEGVPDANIFGTTGDLGSMQ